MVKMIKLGLVGCGNIGTKRLMSILKDKTVRIKYIVGPNKKTTNCKGEEWSKKIKCIFTKDINIILNSDVDAVILSTGPTLFKELGAKILKAKKHLLIEKPLGINDSEASYLTNLANKINLGVTNTIGEYLILLNDDIRIITKSWIEDMLGIFQLKNVGAVGAKLLFPNDSIQHAGVTLLNGLPGHPYYENDSNYYGHNGNVHNLTHYSAVTGACMMTKKSIFNAVGGFDPIFPLNYNDVDYCLKLFEKGYYSIYYPVEMYHYEGVSKKGGRSVSKKEIKIFLSRYGEKFKNDPFYNINLNQSFPYG